MASRSRRTPRSKRLGPESERRVRRHYRIRGWRVLDANAWAGGNELDLVVRRGRRLVFVEVKARSGSSHGDPWEAVTPEKVRRLRRAAEAWLAARPALDGLDVGFEAAAVRRGRIERVRFDW
jgi:putative endonuclease